MKYSTRTELAEHAASMRARNANAPWRRQAARLSWQARRRKPALPPVELAEEQGYQDGFADRHYCPNRHYRTSEEWLAWLQGHRRGQAELAEQRRQREGTAA